MADMTRRDVVRLLAAGAAGAIAAARAAGEAEEKAPATSAMVSCRVRCSCGSECIEGYAHPGSHRCGKGHKY